MSAAVFDFGSAQSLRQLKQNRQALLQVLDNIRATLKRLFETGLIYHVEGSRSGRAMLEAQELLTGVLDAIDAIEDDGEDHPERADRLRELHATLSRVGALTTDAAATLKTIVPKPE